MGEFHAEWKLTTSHLEKGPHLMNPQTSKDQLRASVQRARRQMPPQELANRNEHLCTHVAALLSTMNAPRIAAYVPLPTEPGGPQLIDTVHNHSSELYLPRSNADRSLSWGRYSGPKSLHRGAFKIPEPTSAPFGSSILHSLDLILVPALAVDKAGYRLGKGAGYYDRALQGCRTPTATLVFSNEIVNTLPLERHDIPTTIIISDLQGGTI